MRIKKSLKYTSFAFLFSFLALSASLAWRARPMMEQNESYNAFFPKETFLKKMEAPLPSWIEKQLEQDFKNVRPITAEAVEKAWITIAKRLYGKPFFDQPVHYRILNNKLYKRLDLDGHCSPRDSQYEKALKTLLSHIKVPDLDFILAPMDGVPEPYIESDFYIMDSLENQVPLLAQAKLKEPHTEQIILIPDLFSLSRNWFDILHEINQLNGQIPWEEKLPIAYWRGGFTDKGTPSGALPLFKETPRLQICRASLQYPEQIDAGLNWIEPPEPKEFYVQSGLMKNNASKGEHLRYKYLPSLDGHMCTYPGYHWRLLSDSVCFKQESDQIQWFYDALKPYEHYIPILNDMSDLKEKVLWAKEHDEEIREIIKKANGFARENLLYEDQYRYLYLVLNRYASYQNIDFKKLKKETTLSRGWVSIHYRKRAAVIKMLHRVFERISPSAKSKAL